MVDSGYKLWLDIEHYQQMQDDVSRKAPEEACGLVAGVGNQSIKVYVITNELHSPVRFRMHPQEQVDAILAIEQKGWEMLAIYHSHPSGPGHLSITDIKENAYPGVPYLIWFPHGGKWMCQGFLIQEQQVLDVSLYYLSE